MHMKEDHIRNSQLKPGYNIQFGVEGEYIVGVDVSSERNDQNTLIPLLEQMEKQLGAKYQDVTADAGYESEENYSYPEEKDIGCYIKPSNYERSKTKKFKSNMALREKQPENNGIQKIHWTKSRISETHYKRNRHPALYEPLDPVRGSIWRGEGGL